jgi:uncharacterized protein YndB with AHSA1/START domain
MPIHSCPSDVFHATPSRVWDALTIPRELEKWMGVRMLSGPARALEAGDRLVFGAGLGSAIKVYFDIREAERPTKLALDVRLPFGVVNYEVIQITAMGAAQCRVTFN